MIRQHDSWFSQSLQRPMEFLRFGDRGFPIVMFPTSMGSFHQYEDMNTVAALADKVDAGYIQLFCVDSVDAESWYDKQAHPTQRALRQTQYDDYLRNEMIPYMQHVADRYDVGAFGCSFGGYHAANLAARYPGVVSKAVCLSGIYDIHQFVDGYWDDNCYYNCPTAYIPNMDDEWIGRLRGVQWVIATGEYDSLVTANREFSQLLWSRGVPNRAEIWPGVFGHDWPWWNENVRRFY